MIKIQVKRRRRKRRMGEAEGRGGGEEGKEEERLCVSPLKEFHILEAGWRGITEVNLNYPFGQLWIYK